MNCANACSMISTSWGRMLARGVSGEENIMISPNMSSKSFSIKSENDD